MYVYYWNTFIVRTFLTVILYLRSALFWDVTQRVAFLTDVSGQPIGPIFRGQERVLFLDFMTQWRWDR
jgi:hypothetical protein